MERLMLIIITVISFYIANTVYALSTYDINEYENKTKVLSGGDMSGGGYIVVCKDPVNQKESYELLDYFEGRQIVKNFKLRDLSLVKGSDVFEKAINIISDRIGTWSPFFINETKKIIQDFKKSELAFVSRAVIRDIDDAHTTIDPTSNCQKVQVAVQFKNPSPFEYRVLIDQSIWDKLNENTKIGLIMHEALYKLGLSQGHENSNKIRLLNSILSSQEDFKKLKRLSLFQHVQIDTCYNWDVRIQYSNNTFQNLNIPVMTLSTKIKKGKEYESSIEALTCEPEESNYHRVKFKDDSILTYGKDVIVKLFYNTFYSADNRVEYKKVLVFDGGDDDQNVGYFALDELNSESYLRGSIGFVIEKYFHLYSATEVFDYHLKSLPKFISMNGAYRGNTFFSACGISQFRKEEIFAEIEFRKIAIDYISRNNCTENYSLVFLGDLISLKINSYELVFSVHSRFDSKSLSLLYYGERKLVNLNEQDIIIEKGDVFYFSLEGHFQNKVKRVDEFILN